MHVFLLFTHVCISPPLLSNALPPQQNDSLALSLSFTLLNDILTQVRRKVVAAARRAALDAGWGATGLDPLPGEVAPLPPPSLAPFLTPDGRWKDEKEMKREKKREREREREKERGEDNKEKNEQESEDEGNESDSGSGSDSDSCSGSDSDNDSGSGTESETESDSSESEASKPQKKKKFVTRRKSPYAIFLRERRTALQSERPNMSFGDASRMMGAIWRGMSEEQKAPYVQKSHQEAFEARAKAAAEEREREREKGRAGESAGDGGEKEGKSDEANKERRRKKKKKRRNEKGKRRGVKRKRGGGKGDSEGDDGMVSGVKKKRRKRPRKKSPYSFYMRERHPQFKLEQPGLTFGQMSTIIG